MAGRCAGCTLPGGRHLTDAATPLDPSGRPTVQTLMTTSQAPILTPFMPTPHSATLSTTAHEVVVVIDTACQRTVAGGLAPAPQKAGTRFHMHRNDSAGADTDLHVWRRRAREKHPVLRDPMRHCKCPLRHPSVFSVTTSAMTCEPPSIRPTRHSFRHGARDGPIDQTRRHGDSFDNQRFRTLVHLEHRLAGRREQTQRHRRIGLRRRYFIAGSRAHRFHRGMHQVRFP